MTLPADLPGTVARGARQLASKINDHPRQNSAYALARSLLPLVIAVSRPVMDLGGIALRRSVYRRALPLTRVHHPQARDAEFSSPKIPRAYCRSSGAWTMIGSDCSTQWKALPAVEVDCNLCRMLVALGDVLRGEGVVVGSDQVFAVQALLPVGGVAEKLADRPLELHLLGHRSTFGSLSLCHNQGDLSCRQCSFPP